MADTADSVPPMELFHAPAYSHNETVQIRWRDGCEDDHRYVMATWMRSYGERVKCRRDVFSKHHPSYILRLIRQSRLLIACSPDLTSTIHGWCVGTHKMVHYLYVPPELRRKGLGKAMITNVMGSYAGMIECSHRWPFVSNRFLYVPYPEGINL